MSETFDCSHGRDGDQMQVGMYASHFSSHELEFV